MFTRVSDASIEDIKVLFHKVLQEGILSHNVRRLAEVAIRNTADGKVVAVSNFVKSTFPYLADPEGMELFVHPNRMAEDYFQGRIRSEDCDGLALLTAAMLGSIGYRTRIALLATRHPELDHVVAQVYSGEFQDWIFVDSSSRNPVGWVPGFYKMEIVE